MGLYISRSLDAEMFSGFSVADVATYFDIEIMEDEAIMPGVYRSRPVQAHDACAGSRTDSARRAPCIPSPIKWQR